MREVVVIAIDGPVQSGKSTVARKVAKKLHFIHLNSGLLYRSVGSEAAKRGISLDEEDALVELASHLKFSYELLADGSTAFKLNDELAEERLSGMEVGELASRVAIHARLRSVVTEVQREVGKTSSLVLEGRDAGTVVFPNTRHKYYLDADPEVRIQRRVKALQAQGDTTPRDELIRRVRAELAMRDERDMTREASPTVKAEDAIRLDTSELSADEVAEKLVSLFLQSQK